MYKRLLLLYLIYSCCCVGGGATEYLNKQDSKLTKPENPVTLIFGRSSNIANNYVNST